MKTRDSLPVITITMTAMFTAMTIVLSSFGIPVPGGHFYLCDIIICTGAILMDPLPAFVIGGIGSFLGDAFFYPAPMFVSLITHGVQAVIISQLAHRKGESPHLRGSILGVTVGAVVMIIGYTLGRAFVYSTPEYAIIKLPFEILQAGIGAAASIVIVFHMHVKDLYRRMTN